MKATTTPVPDARPCEYDRSRTYGWNGENRLISAENGDTRLEFNYDYMGRRFEKKVYTANVLTKHEKFVYDGYKLIQVLDALNSDAVTMAFAWHPESTGLDTPFSMTYDGETYVHRDGENYKILFYKDDVLKGYILIGDVARAGIYTALIRNRTPLSSIDFKLICEKPQLMAFTARTRRDLLSKQQ